MYGFDILATRPKEMVSIGQAFDIDVLIRRQGRAGTRMRALPSPTLQLEVVKDNYFQHTVSPLFTLGEEGEVWVKVVLSPFPGSQLRDLRPFYTLKLFDPVSGDVLHDERFENVVSDYLGGLAGKDSPCGSPNLYVMGLMAAGKSTLVSLIAQTLGWVEPGVALEVHARSSRHVTRDLNLYDSASFGATSSGVGLNFRLCSGFGMDAEKGLNGVQLEEYLSGEWLVGRKIDAPQSSWFERMQTRWLGRLSRAAHAYCFVVDWEEVVRNPHHLEKSLP